MVTRVAARLAGAEQRLKELGIELPAPPEPFGSYAEAVQTGNLLFLSGMLPTEGHQASVVGRLGKDKSPCRLVYGVASLPLGTPVELEVIFEVEA